MRLSKMIIITITNQMEKRWLPAVLVTAIFCCSWRNSEQINLLSTNFKKDTIMKNEDFTTSILVDQSPSDVFNAITNVRGWWSEEIEGNTAKLNDEFKYHFEDIHRCRMKLEEVVQDKKIVWHVLENYFKPTVVKDRKEWIDTKLFFEISKEGDKTRLTVTHKGLVPSYECFEICSAGWTQYINTSLYNLITTGKGNPNKTGRPTTAVEESLRG